MRVAKGAAYRPELKPFMETANTAVTTAEKRAGILYPAMLIAAIAVIVFSVVGIATMLGWLPSAISKNDPPARIERAAGNDATPCARRPRAAHAAACSDCGVIEKNMNRSTRYQIRVRMNDGAYRTFYERSQPALGIGQKVRVTDQEFVGLGTDKLL